MGTDIDLISLIKDYLNDTLKAPAHYTRYIDPTKFQSENYAISRVNERSERMVEFREIVGHIEKCDQCAHDSLIGELCIKLQVTEIGITEYTTTRDLISKRVSDIHS